MPSERRRSNDVPPSIDRRRRCHRHSERYDPVHRRRPTGSGTMPIGRPMCPTPRLPGSRTSGRAHPCRSARAPGPGAIRRRGAAGSPRRRRHATHRGSRRRATGHAAPPSATVGRLAPRRSHRRSSSDRTTRALVGSGTRRLAAVAPPVRASLGLWRRPGTSWIGRRQRPDRERTAGGPPPCAQSGQAASPPPAARARAIARPTKGASTAARKRTASMRY